jgi:hypothetical protein
MSDKMYRFEYFDTGDCHRKFTGTFVAAEWEVEDAIGKVFDIPDVVKGVLKAEHFTLLKRTDNFVAKIVREFKSRSLAGMNPLPYVIEEDD